MAFGGTLTARESGFDLTYYFPGPDRRYNGTILRIDASMLQQYVAAWEENWRTYRVLRASMPSLCFSAEGKFGMRVDAAGVRLHKLRVSNDAELDAMLNMLRQAKKRGSELQRDILARLGRVEMPFDERQARFTRFKSGERLGQCTNPAVVQELERALKLVRSKFKVEINSCRHHVSNWFGKQAAQEFMEDIRRHGLDVFCEQADFVITWMGRQ
jgi:hypothetical protein